MQLLLKLLFLSDKCVSESSEWGADRCHRTGYIRHRQENDTGGKFNLLQIYSDVSRIF